MGYRANANARRLATGRTGTIGMILTTDQKLLVDPYFVEFLAGVGTYLENQDTDLLVSINSPKNEQNTYRRMIFDKRVDGIILSSPRIGDVRIKDLNNIQFPFVLHGRSDIVGDYSYLDIDNEGAFFAATNLLLDLGHHSISLLNQCPKIMMFARHREIGYRKAFQKRQLAINNKFICCGEMNEENGFRYTLQQLQLDNPPTAILCSSTLMALGAFRAIEGQGLIVGRDISVVAHDDGLPFLKPDEMCPALTTTYSSIRAAGSKISSMLLNQIRFPTYKPGYIWPVEIVIRDSVTPVDK